MTFEEMEKPIQELRDNQVVQGHRLARTESNLDRLEEIVERNSRAISKLADGFILLQSAMKGLVQTVEGLSATVDRFIRGMEHNGHRGSDEGPEGVP